MMAAAPGLRLKFSKRDTRSAHFMQVQLVRLSVEASGTEDVPVVSAIDGKPFEPRHLFLVLATGPVDGQPGGVGSSVATGLPAHAYFQCGGGPPQGAPGVVGAICDSGGNGWNVVPIAPPDQQTVRLNWTKLLIGLDIQGTLVVIGRRR